MDILPRGNDAINIYPRILSQHQNMQFLLEQILRTSILYYKLYNTYLAIHNLLSYLKSLYKDYE